MYRIINISQMSCSISHFDQLMKVITSQLFFPQIFHFEAISKFIQKKLFFN